MTRSVTLAAATGLSLAATAHAQEKLHFTYLWHMEQPIYWPDQKAGSPDRYEYAWESILRTDAGATNPENDLREIFGKPDRVAAYQYRVKDAINAIDWAPEAGAQMSFSGGLIQNLESIGNANQLGYSPNWNTTYAQARGNTTAGQSKPRLDIVIFPFHHALMPLLSESTQRKEIRAYQHAYASTWGNAAPRSRGFFPSEMAFSTRMIKVLNEEGIDWSIVSAEKISRANADFPVVLGSGGINCDPPNKADQINPGTHDYFRMQISRGCSPAEAFPQSLTPQRSQYVDPATGDVHEIIVIPASQSVSWIDGSNPIGTESFDTLQTGNDPSRPMLVTLAHDGDNFFGGGFSYYLEATPNLVSAAQSSGYHATVVEEYLADHPVPPNAIVHVEDGAWVNADGDFGSPWFLNWNYPPVNQQGQVDIENGWAEDIRNWAVITAAQNAVDTAEQIASDAGQPVRIGHIVEPTAATRPAERAWHYFLGALNSGYMYYGTALDFEVKPTIACNEALQHAFPVIASGSDATGPEIWIPQRWPWNPGELNFGAPFGYQAYSAPTSFHIWTFIHDVSGTQSVTLKIRSDDDGTNPLTDHANETYAGGPGVGQWQSIPMTARAFPAGNALGDPGIDFFEMPQAIADQYYAHIDDLESVLIDYYVEATDTLGNVTRSPIQHVWIGDGSGSTGPGTGDPRVTTDPESLTAGDTATIYYEAAGGPLASAAQVYAHVGFNGWANVVSPDRAMTYNPADNHWSLSVTIPTSASEMNLVFNDGQGTWDNNNGQDWRFAVEGTSTPGFTLDGTLDAAATLVASNDGIDLHAALEGTTLYVAMTAPANEDHFLLLADQPGPLRSAMWAKSGQIAGWGAFIGAESTNSYAGWFDASSADIARGSVVEGVIDLSAEFGALPEQISLAALGFGTNDAGTLESQAPIGNGNTTLEAGEYLTIDLCALTVDGCETCPADINNDGLATPADFTAWILAFNNRSPACDQNNDGLCSPQDFTAWILNFNTGCTI
ncbi:MAG: carbohydrate-binding protein [Planctomycetota bacterium]